MAITKVMDKLGLKTIPHAKPYKLSWLSEEGEIKVDKQVLINFIGNYKDEVLCDLVPMEATHIEGHGNLIGKLFMMAMPKKLHLASKAKRSHYYLFHQEKSMRTNCK